MAKWRIGNIGSLTLGVMVAGAAWTYFKDKSKPRTSYDVLDTDGAFELRSYPALGYVQTVQSGIRDRALGTGMGVLAEYIFAENREGEALPMHAPLLALHLGERDWRIRLPLPEDMVVADLPEPESGMTLEEYPAMTVATIRFGGRADDALLARKTAQLAAWLDARSIQHDARFEHAFYNIPLIPGPLRHNEIWTYVTI